MFDSVVTQKAFSELIGVSESAVSQMLSEGLLPRDATLREWCQTYCGRLREQAAGRAAVGDIGLATERARLAREQADKIAMQNAVTRRELAPVHVIEQVFSRTGSRVAAILEALPGAIKRRVPALGADEIGLVQREIAQARNAIATMSIDDIIAPDPVDAEPPAGTDPAPEIEAG